MSDVSQIGRDSVEQQAEIFRLAESRFGLKISHLSDRTGIPLSTMKGWRAGSAIPAWGLFALKTAGVPDELLSLVSLPFGCSVTSRTEIDLEELCEIAAELDKLYADSRRPNSECGVELSHREFERIHACAEKLRARAGVAA